MRPIQFYDLHSAVRALLAVSKGQRRVLSRRLVMAADVADRFRKRTGHAHPDFGTGTLQAAAQGFELAAEPRCCHRQYRQCLAIVLEALATREAHHQK